MPRLPKLPELVQTKLRKTGETRGATDGEIYQNRVSRSGVVLVPYECYSDCEPIIDQFRDGLIYIIRPELYFQEVGIAEELSSRGIALGGNALLVYQTRLQWELYNPESRGLSVATSRTNPLGGEYIARIAKRTNQGDILRGFTTTQTKGAGIRVFEYASNDNVSKCKIQLEFLFWSCHDSVATCLSDGLTEAQIRTRQTYNANIADALGLSNLDLLRAERMINDDGVTVCPLCLEPLSAMGFINKMEAALGREVHDSTITEISLFHIHELRVGELNHKPYNLGWGHHHCNTVAKDTGIMETLDWMRQVLVRNS